MVFPLPVTPFEYYYICDDRPQYPTVFPLRVTLDGQLNRPDLETALALIAARHPMIAARLDRTSHRWPQWVAAEAPRLESQPKPVEGDDHIDVGNRTFRLWHEPGEQTTTLWFLFHHACVDGLSGLQLIEELFVAYDHVHAGKSGEPAWRPLEPERLKSRGEYGMAGYKPKPVDLLNVARVWVPLLAQRCDVVESTHKQPLPGATVPFGCSPEWLSVAETRELHARGRELGVTVNDLLLRDLFVVLRAWNQDHGRRSKRIRICVPNSLRLPEDDAMPAANVLSYCFISRPDNMVADPAALLKSIRIQTDEMKRYRLGLLYVGGLAVGSAFRGMIPAMLKRRWSFATAVFTNVGTLYKHSSLANDEGHLVAGEAVFRSIVGVPPIRRETKLVLTALTYAGRLGLYARCDRFWFTPAEERALLDRYLAQVRRTIAGESPSVS